MMMLPPSIVSGRVNGNAVTLKKDAAIWKLGHAIRAKFEPWRHGTHDFRRWGAI